MRTLFGLLVGLFAGLAVAAVILVVGPASDSTAADRAPTGFAPLDEVEGPRLPRLTSDTMPAQPADPPGLE